MSCAVQCCELIRTQSLLQADIQVFILLMRQSALSDAALPKPGLFTLPVLLNTLTAVVVAFRRQSFALYASVNDTGVLSPSNTAYIYPEVARVNKVVHARG